MTNGIFLPRNSVVFEFYPPEFRAPMYCSIKDVTRSQWYEVFSYKSDVEVRRRRDFADLSHHLGCLECFCIESHILVIRRVVSFIMIFQTILPPGRFPSRAVRRKRPGASLTGTQSTFIGCIELFARQLELMEFMQLYTDLCSPLYDQALSYDHEAAAREDL